LELGAWGKELGADSIKHKVESAQRKADSEVKVNYLLISRQRINEIKVTGCRFTPTDNCFPVKE